MWYDEAVVYQIYPLGLCGAPLQNDGDQAQAGEHRILRVLDWVEHIKRLGATCVLFNPLFESDAHGYDTRDYNKVDCRLGTNDDLRQVCAALHAAGIKILFDGVFNHVGRGFWAFKDVQEKRWDSPYKDWFHISFDGRSTEPGSAPKLLAELDEKLDAIGVGRIVDGVGRGVALDRDKNYDKVKRAYDAMVDGAGTRYE